MDFIRYSILYTLWHSVLPHTFVSQILTLPNIYNNNIHCTDNPFVFHYLISSPSQYYMLPTAAILFEHDINITYIHILYSWILYMFFFFSFIQLMVIIIWRKFVVFLSVATAKLDPRNINPLFHVIFNNISINNTGFYCDAEKQVDIACSINAYYNIGWITEYALIAYLHNIMHLKTLWFFWNFRNYLEIIKTRYNDLNTYHKTNEQKKIIYSTIVTVKNAEVLNLYCHKIILLKWHIKKSKILKYSL